MALTETAQPIQTRVTIGDRVIHIESFHEFDPATVSYINQSDDPIFAVGQLLRIGARALQAVGNEIATENLQMHLDALSKDLTDTVGEAIEKISSVTESIVDDETGQLPKKLKDFTEDLESRLGKTFDPESKNSVMAGFEKLMSEAADNQTSTIRQMVTLEDENSTLNRLKRDLIRDFNESFSESFRNLRKDFDELREKIAIEKIAKDAREKSFQKGLDFEQVIHDEISSIAAAHGDIAEFVGNMSGSDENKKGDELVQVNREDANGIEAFFVWEAKATKLSMKKVHEELDQSMSNRNARAAILIFEDHSLSPTTVPFHCSDNKAIVSLNKNLDDNSAIRLAYMWARWVVRRDLNQGMTEKFNAEKVESLLESVIRSLNLQVKIKSSHNKAIRNIETASDLSKTLQTEVQETLEELREALQIDEKTKGGITR